MKKIEVFDPPLCCSTGVCGPSVDPTLVRFSADIDWLKGKGVPVERYNLAQQPGAFAGNVTIRTALTREGNSCLPLILADAAVVSKGVYPDRRTLAAFAGLAVTEKELTAGIPLAIPLVGDSSGGTSDSDCG